MVGRGQAEVWETEAQTGSAGSETPGAAPPPHRHCSWAPGTSFSGNGVGNQGTVQAAVHSPTLPSSRA